MPETNEIEYLYHYTSIEKLALILKNRTIRLNPLDKMDDLQEQKTADVENLGKFVFVSSWTADTTESIPMWKMYTDPRAGVRIRLKKNPFKWQNTIGKDVAKVLGIPTADEATLNAEMKSFLDLSKLLDNGYISVQAVNGNILEKVNYTDDMSKLEPKVLYAENQNLSLHIGDLGKHKNVHWTFQKEWRYIMSFIPINLKESMEVAEKSFTSTMVKMIQGIEQPPFQYFDLEIESIFFDEMEITCSPQMTPGNRILLETLIAKYNPSAKIVESELLGKI